MSSSAIILERDWFAQRPGFRVTVHRELSQADTDQQHRHSFYEIAWIAGGSGVHLTGEFQHRIQAGDVLVLDPRRPHGYRDCNQLHLVNILLDPGLLPELHRTLGHQPGFQRLFWLAGEHWQHSAYSGRLRLTGRDPKYLEHWVNQMEAETHSSLPEAPVLAESWVLQIAALLSRRAGDQPSVKPESSPPAGISRLFSWVELHLQDPLRLSDLAREAGLSPRSLQRHFREQSGEPPMQYVRTRRMARAKQVLARHPELPVAEVAARCGYPDPNHFSMAVRKYFQLTPRDLRNQSAPSDSTTCPPNRATPKFP